MGLSSRLRVVERMARVRGRRVADLVCSVRLAVSLLCLTTLASHALLLGFAASDTLPLR